MILGDLMHTLPGALRHIARRHIGSRAAMVHSDIGSGDKSESPRRAHTLAPLLAPGAIVVSDQDMAVVGWSDVALPAGVTPGRYYMYRVA